MPTSRSPFGWIPCSIFLAESNLCRLVRLSLPQQQVVRNNRRSTGHVEAFSRCNWFLPEHRESRLSMHVMTKFRKSPAVVAEEPRRVPRSPKKSAMLDKSIVAELSMAAIDNMDCEELVLVIRAAELGFLQCSDLNRRLPFYDRETLVRMAYLARRCCQFVAGVSVWEAGLRTQLGAGTSYMG